MPALDGIRAIAILAVMGFHVVVELAPGGSIGVDVFFGLSGFLITGILLGELNSSSKITLSTFYWRRAGRLLPALTLLVLVVGPISAVILGSTSIVPDSLKAFFYVADFAEANLAFGSIHEPYGHTWSLAVEEQFYLMWPFVMWGAFRLRASPALVTGVMLTASFPVRWFSEAALGGARTYFLPTGHLWALAVGTFAAALLHRANPGRLVEVASTPTAAAVAWVIILATVAIPLPRLPVGVLAILTVALAATLFVVVVNAAVGHSWITRVLSVPVLLWFGTRSYGLYLFHTALFQVFTRPYIPLPRSVTIALGLAVSFVVAEVSFRYIENPARAWMRRRTTASLTKEPA